MKTDPKGGLRLVFNRDAISRVVTDDEDKDAGDAKKLGDSSESNRG